VTRRSRAAAALLVALTVPACSSTVDQTIATPAGTVATTTLPPISPDAPLAELVAELADAMRHLDEQVVAGDREDVTLARIEELWSYAEPLARERSAEFVFGLEQSVDLARTSVQRRRPADASKGYKIVADLLVLLDRVG
jgi:hypothetical protein